MLSRLLTACYTLFTQHAAAFLVIGFVILTGVSAGIVTGDVMVDTVRPFGILPSLAISVTAFIALALCGVTPILTPVVLIISGFYGYSVGVRAPLMRPDGWAQLPGTLMSGTGALIALCAVCAAASVALGTSVRWTRGLSIPVNERAVRLYSHYVIMGVFWLIFVLGAVISQFMF